MKDYTITRADLVDKVHGNDGQLTIGQPLTMGNLARVLTLLGVGLRYNVMIGEVVYVDEGVPLACEQACERLELRLRGILKVCGITAQSDLGPMLVSLARGDEFHPMAEWLGGLVWDGADHLAAAIEAVSTTTSLWPVFLENWLIQVVDAVCGWPGRRAMSLPYVLVLVGGQGVGKTAFLAALGGPWLRSEAELHLSSNGGKDHQIEALRWPMVELSELDGIFRKADVEHMKSFISRSEDALRAPYGRKPVKNPRRTVFCGSVNESQFLNDPSGSRRFWPVNVTGIDWAADIDWGGVWAQMYAAWLAEPSFTLTVAEDAERAKISLDQHTETTPEAEMIDAYLTAHMGSEFECFPLNTVGVMKLLGLNYNNPKAKKSAREAISRYLGISRTISRYQRVWMVPVNDDARNVRSWPAPKGVVRDIIT
tara:strand:- start:247 stop:1521 length:1275 start_codon:yes stop_codon:yes gene_type:complete